MSISAEEHRPRNLDWKRAAALLYGDWGTSKAYVIGLAFVAAGFGALPVIVAVSVLTAVVGFNYIIVCRSFPDGGGVYSAARDQSRLLASVGALLLVANFLVTAALSGWAAVSYFGVPPEFIRYATMGLVLVVGVLNFFGPRHSGSVAVWLAVPTVAVVVGIIALSAPHLKFDLPPMHGGFKEGWIALVGVILALSGVEAVANLTGVMRLDPGSTPESPKVVKTATRAILPVALEVVVGTALLGWAMLSMPHSMGPTMLERKEDMLRLLGEFYGAETVGPWFGHGFGIAVGLVFGLLLFSAVNTAVVALIGVLYMMARDGELPRPMARLNRHGVPRWPLAVAVGLPVLVLAAATDFEALAGLYAIGVVGAITVNLGSCTINRKIALHWYERALMGVTFLVLLAIELTIAKTKPDALFFAVCVLGVGLSLRAWSHKVSGLETVTLSREVADLVRPEARELFKPQIAEGQRILVAAQGLTPVMSYALDEAKLRGAMLYVLYVKRVAVMFSGPVGRGKRMKWEDDPRASAIMSVMMKEGQDRGVTVVPVYAEHESPSSVILDYAATLGVDFVFMGGSQRQGLAALLSGDVIRDVATSLPEEIKLVIYG